MKRFMFLILMTSMFFVGCDDDDDVSGGTGTLSVRLTDDPGDYEKVLIDVDSLSINYSSDANDQNGWIGMALITSGQIDLMGLTNGKDVLLAEEEFDVGTIGQMRLILGENNQLKLKGEETLYDLETPSAEQSGLKFNINATLEPGVPYKMWIDFDASKSIVEKGNGTYSLKPVIKVFTEEASAIMGVVVAAADGTTPVPSALVEATMGTETSSTYTDETGAFLINGLDAGTYEVKITTGGDYMEKIIPDGVTTTIGVVSDIGTVELMMETPTP